MYPLLDVNSKAAERLKIIRGRLAVAASLRVPGAESTLLAGSLRGFKIASK